jgi:hypothetical protein
MGFCNPSSSFAGPRSRGGRPQSMVQHSTWAHRVSRGLASIRITNEEKKIRIGSRPWWPLDPIPCDDGRGFRVGIGNRPSLIVSILLHQVCCMLDNPLSWLWLAFGFRFTPYVTLANERTVSISDPRCNCYPESPLAVNLGKAPTHLQKGPFLDAPPSSVCVSHLPLLVANTAYAYNPFTPRTPLSLPLTFSPFCQRSLRDISIAKQSLFGHTLIGNPRSLCGRRHVDGEGNVDPSRGCCGP